MPSSWKDRLTSRQAKFGLNTALYVLAALAIVVIVNLIAIRVPTQIGKFHTNWQWDVTSNKRYSLSEETTEILSKLNKDVQIIYFDKRDNFGNVKDLLDQLPRQSHHVTVTYVDPDREPNKANQYNVKTYGTIVIAAAGRVEQSKGAKEEDIINAIIRVLREQTKKIYFLQGHGERQIDNSERLGYSEAKKAIETISYQTAPLTLLEEKPQIPNDCTILVIAGPQKDPLDPELGAIRTFLQQGGRVFMLSTPFTPPKFVDFFKEFGADISNTLVVDVSGIGKLFGTDELMPLALQYEANPITKDMGDTATLFPFASVVAPTKEMPIGAEFTVIAKTTDKSWATHDVKSKEVSFHEGKDIQGPVGLMGAGTFHEPSAPMAIEGRLVVSGSADLISNAILNFNGNRDLFLNSIAWLSSEEDLISIRPKNPEERTIDMTPGQLQLVKYFALLFVPLIIVGGGLSVWWNRRD